MEIKAAVTYEKSAPFKIEQIEIDDPRDNEVLVRIVGSGICHTDLAAREQMIPYPLPGVLGHEGSGIVEKVGKNVKRLKPGDHVAMSWDCCHQCKACRSGMDPYCEVWLPTNFAGLRSDGSTSFKKDGKVIHGAFFCQSAFATHALTNETSAVKVREDVPLEMLAPLGCGVQTGVGAVFNSLKPNPGDSIAVFGCGTVGMSAILGAVIKGCTTIVAIDLVPERLELAKELGATHVINAKDTDPVQAIMDITKTGINFALECVGNPNILNQAVNSLGILGVCGQVGAVAPGTPVTLNMDQVMNGRTVKGIIEGDSVPEIFIPILIELYMQGKLPFDRLIKYYDFDDINKAVEDMEKGIVIKPVLKP
ncbi:MAG: NAD(P)-dependent alcohol dehydrogenase [Spirochaetes bacterium]|nr:NAD(P)-dependent alcohol dehydrogenase [Spirochaetota bacterium]